MDKIVVFVSLDKQLRKIELNKFLKSINDCEIINTDDDIITIINDLDTMSLFSSVKVIVSENPAYLNQFTDEEFKKFKEYLDNPSDNYFIISVCELKDNKMVKALKNTAKIIEIEERNSKNLKEYITKYFKDLNINIKDECIDYIMENAIVETIDQELEKLYTYAFSSGVLLINDIKMLLTKNTDSKIYELTSAILERDKNKIMGLYNELLKSSEDSIRIINSIAYKFEELLYVKDLVNNNYQAMDIAKYFRVSQGRAYHMIKDSKKVSYEALRKNISRLSDLDYKVKSGLINPKLGLEMYLLD